MRLLLASKSAARARILEAAGVPFEAVDAQFDEDGVKAALRERNLGAAELALALAEAKARAVTAGVDDLVLGSDQTFELEDGSMLDKAGSREELLAQLRRLGGRRHKLHAAACVVEGGRVVWQDAETAVMHVRLVGDGFLNDYVDWEWDQVRWSVGGYQVEGRGAQLFERIEGSHFAVQGLPLLPLLAFLREQRMLLT
jgi:septum formation protein